MRYGILEEDKMKLDYVLGLKVENFFDRRLQTQARRLAQLLPAHGRRSSSLDWPSPSTTPVC